MSDQSAPTTPILEVRNLTVNFGSVRAVDDVSFDLSKGEILGVIGPNGAGKTTMFDAISGFVPSRGSVTLDGEKLSGLAPETRSRHGLGRSFQDARLFPSLTVSEALAVALERHIHAQDVVSTALRLPWVSRAEKRIKVKTEELIELMGLGAFRDKFVSELSTGSRRIVDLAVIMAHEPKVLLLDEPSSGIAQKETEALAPLLFALRDQTGASLIVVEHDMPLIQSVSDDLLALETGAVLMRGTPEEVISDPRLVASYLGTDQATIARSGTARVGTSSSSNGWTPAETTATGSRTARTTAAPRRTAAKETAAKNTAAKNTAAKKTAAKRAATKKAATKTTTAEKATTKKTTAKKATAKKAATPNRVAAAKGTARRVAR